MDLALTGRRALVTGASSGLGLGCAQALAAEGAEVTLVARDAERLAAAAATIASSTHTLVGDLSDLDAIAGLVAAADDLMGGVDILIVNAGGPPAGTFGTIAFQQYEAALRLNLQAYENTAPAEIEARRVLVPWSEETLTWNNQPASTPPVTSTVVAKIGEMPLVPATIGATLTKGT